MRRAGASEFAVLGVIAVLILNGCGLPPKDEGRRPAQPQRVVGTLYVDGSNAFLNKKHVSNGTPVYDGDTVETGLGTSVKLVLIDGGYIQLDEKTDPRFTLFKEGSCLLVKIAVGQAFIDAKHVCIDDPDLRFTVNSRVNWLHTAGGQVHLTNLEGSVDVTKPVHLTLAPGEQATVVAGRVSVVTLSAELLRAVTAWLRKFKFDGVPTTPGTVVPRPVPRLVGRRVDDARAVLRREGLVVGRVVEEFTGHAQAGTVLRTDPREGAPARPDASVDLAVESTSVPVTAANVNTIVKILNAVTERLNNATTALNGENVAGAEVASREARAEFARLDREFRSAGGGHGPLQELYDLATASRELQKERIGLTEAMIRAKRGNDTPAYNAAGTKLNANKDRLNAKINRINELTHSLR